MVLLGNLTLSGWSRPRYKEIVVHTSHDLDGPRMSPELQHQRCKGGVRWWGTGTEHPRTHGHAGRVSLAMMPYHLSWLIFQEVALFTDCKEMYFPSWAPSTCSTKLWVANYGKAYLQSRSYVWYLQAQNTRSHHGWSSDCVLASPQSLKEVMSVFHCCLTKAESLEVELRH